MHVGLAAVTRARRLRDRVLHRMDDDAAVDRFLARDGVGDLQKFELVGADDGHEFVSILAGKTRLLRRRPPGMSRLAGRSPMFAARVPQLARLAILGLAAPQQFGDQVVSKHELGLEHLLDRQRRLPLLARRPLNMDAGRLPVHSGQEAAKPPPPLDGVRHLHLDLAADMALEVGPSHQRPIDAWGGDLQPIAAIERVGDVEQRRKRARGGLRNLRSASCRPAAPP